MNDSTFIRIPAVSGLFYPDKPAELIAMLDAAFESEKATISCTAKTGSFITGGVVPHAGMVYCARHAVHFFECYRRSGQRADTVVIVHPNHHGIGPRMSVDGHGSWQTPLGKIDVDYVTQVLRRGHSGEVSPSNRVVNYISILFETSGAAK